MSVRKLVALPTLGKVSINFYCSSEEIVNLYERIDEFERQKKIRHLGLISTVFEGASHTRYEYLMLQTAITDLLDNIHKGSATAAQGKLTIDGKSYSGNGILKTWFLLSNFGHAKNTIGDEKSLLLFSLRQNGFKSHLLRPVADKALKTWSEDVIKNFRYTDFHHILSIRRLYKVLSRETHLRDYLLKLYKLLLLEPENIAAKVNTIKVDQLKRIFSTVRALSIVTIDGHYSHSPISCDLISTVISVESIESTYKDQFLLKSIEPLLSILHETIYLDRDVLAAQREYETKSLAYLSGCPKTATSYEASINKSLKKGLVDYRHQGIFPFTRLSISERINSGRGFYDEFRNILTVKRKCKGVEASLDRNPITNQKFADFFIQKNVFTPHELPRFVYNICGIIRDQIKSLVASSGSEIRDLVTQIKQAALDEGIEEVKIDRVLDSSKKAMGRIAWVAFKRDIFPSYKELFWSILKYFLKDNYHIDIENANKHYDVFGLKFPNGDVGFLKNNINAAIEEEKNDKDRIHELSQLMYAANRKFDGYVFVCLSRIKIFDQSKPPAERIITDIDSSVIKAGKEKIVIELNESKNMKSNIENRAVKELRQMVVPVLNSNAKGYRVQKVKGFGGKLVIKIEKK